MLEQTKPMLNFAAQANIGWLAVRLCSDAAETMTRVVLPIDGAGWHIEWAGRMMIRPGGT